MKQIFLTIQTQLQSEVPELKYIDKDWGQLKYDKPPVKFPCALIDITNVNYSQMGRGYQKADADIIITIANMKLIRSSAMAPSKIDSYDTIDILESVHQALQLFADGQKFQPLQRTNLKKIFNDKDAEVYAMLYKTSFIVEKTQPGKITVQVSPIISAK